MSEDWTDEDIETATKLGWTAEQAKELFEMAGRWGREKADGKRCAADLRAWLERNRPEPEDPEE